MLKARAHTIFHTKRPQTWKVMYCKIDLLSSVHGYFIMKNIKNNYYTCKGKGSSKPPKALLTLNFKSKTIRGYIKCWAIALKKIQNATLAVSFSTKWGGFPPHLFTTGSVWFCDYWRAVRTHRYRRACSGNSEADALTCGPNGRPHDALGKGELAVTTEKEQISRVNVNVQLGLCTQPPFFSSPTSPHDGFFMSHSILPSSPQFWYDYKQIGIYVIIFARGWVLCFLFLYVRINSCRAGTEQECYTAPSYLWL